MHLDWYDRSILTYVLDSGLRSRAEVSDDTPVHFGITAGRIAARFDAVLDVYASRQPLLEQPDLDLVRRAARYRDTGERR
jgi:hypothetical protein